jgi:hypothetical protein
MKKYDNDMKPTLIDVPIGSIGITEFELKY